MNNILKNNIIFKNMNEAEINKCIELLSARIKKFSKGTQILRVGDTTHHMGIVLSGSVTIESRDSWGSGMVLTKVQAGGIFAETYALVPGAVLHIDVTTDEATEIMFLNMTRVLQAPSSDDLIIAKLNQNLLQVAIRKNLMLSRRSFHTAPKTIRGKVLSYLSTVSMQKHAIEFDIPFDRQQLADYLNVERSALSKELGKMKADKLINFDKNHFILHIDIDYRKTELEDL